MADWGLKEPFDIDDGQLDGLSPQMCFVLGVEWQMVYESVRCSCETTRPIHVENVARVAALCRRHNRQWKLAPAADETWYDLTILEEPT